MSALKLIVVALALLFTACRDHTENDQLLESIRRLQLVNSPGLAFREVGGGSLQGGTASSTGRVESLGEIVSTDGSPLPPELAISIADNIRTELEKHGCLITGVERGGGINHTPDPPVSNANIQKASLSYSFNGARGHVIVLVIERDFSLDKQTRVVGQLLLVLNELR